MSTTPNQKDLLAKKSDLEGILKPDANDILHLPDITISLAENQQGYSTSTLSKDGLIFAGGDTITGITSSSGNSTTLAASQSMVSAKQDVLTAGSNITIQNNTISAIDTNELENLTDVNITTPTDGQGLVYNDTTQKWENGNVSSASSIDTLTDVNLTNLTNGQILKYNSTSQEWENANESGGGTAADELTLSEYNALTTEQKNDGMIRFIPESNIGSSTAINMSYITKFKEADMDTIATSSSETTITWSGGVYIGNTYYYTTAIDVTDYDNIIFDLTTGSCYGGGSSAQQTRWNIQIGLMSVAPTTVLVIDATDSSWAVCKDFANSNTVYSDQELDVSELTGSYYLVINAHGWNATLENFILATAGGNPSQIKYMDKTYANNSGGGTTVVANPQDPATDTLTKIQIGNTVYEIEGGGSSSGGLRSTTLLSTPITATGTYTLADSYTNYDFIGFRAGNGSNETDILLYPVKEITDAMNDSLIITNPVTNSWFNFTMSGSSLVITGKTVDTIYSVIGYKISGGSGGSGGFITYSTTATLTQYGWWTVEDKDGNTLNPDDYIIIDISVPTDNSSSWNGAYDVLWYHETGDNYYAATFVDINDGRFPRSSGSFPITVTYAPKDGGGGAGLPNNYTVTADSLKINNEAPSTGVDWIVEDDTDYFDSAASITVSTRVYQKTNAVPALGGVYIIYASGSTWTTVMFTSTDATAVGYSGNTDPFGSFTYLGHTWYFSGTDYAMSGDNSSAVSGARYIGDFSQYDYSTKECCIEAAKYLIDHAGVSFEENNFTTISRPSTGYIIAGGGSAPDFSDATFKVTKQGDIYSKGNLLEDIFQKKSQELTSSQYENLTLAEKTNGTIYFINDPVPGERQLISRVSEADSHISASSSESGYPPWAAFNGKDSGGRRNPTTNTRWMPATGDTTPWIQYHFDESYYLIKLEIHIYSHYSSSGNGYQGNLYILGSNDGSTWTNISSTGEAVTMNTGLSATSDSGSGLATVVKLEYDLNGSQKYEYIRLQGDEAWSVYYGYACDFDDIYVYGTDQGSPAKKIYYMGVEYSSNTGGGGSSSHTYSTTEQIVGTWIDGSDIYEKSFEVTITETMPIIEQDASYIDALISYDAVVKNSLGYISGVGMGASGWGFALHRNPSAQLLLYGNLSEAIGGKAYVTIRYTKVT